MCVAIFVFPGWTAPNNLLLIVGATGNGVVASTTTSGPVSNVTMLPAAMGTAAVLLFPVTRWRVTVNSFDNNCGGGAWLADRGCKDCCNI